MASQEAIKELGTNGGGFYNANSSHPFENPNAWINLFEIFLLLVIPFSLPRFRPDGRQHPPGRGRGRGDGRPVARGRGPRRGRSWPARDGPLGSAMEGKEVRFGEAASALFAVSTTGTSTGSVNTMHDSMTALGGGVTLANMMLGEVSPGGVGVGLYGMLVLPSSRSSSPA